MRHQNQNRITDFANRCKVFDCVEGDGGEHVWVDHHGAVKAQEQRIAIWLGCCNLAGANVARRTGLIFNNHLVPKTLTHLLGHETGACVCHAARGEGHD